MQKKKMVFISILLALIIGSVVWKLLIENYAESDIIIPISSNIDYSNQFPTLKNIENIVKKFEANDNKPILLYLFTTWCKVCNNNFNNINELAREFQNTDLVFISLAIDRDLDIENFNTYIKNLAPVYFEPLYLGNRNGFLEFLKQKKITYKNRIPYTILFARDGSISADFSGVKSPKYLRSKIIKELYSSSK
jgi:thiol-disulfide isomerase/thioredoxin